MVAEKGREGEEETMPRRGPRFQRENPLGSDKEQVLKDHPQAKCQATPIFGSLRMYGIFLLPTDNKPLCVARSPAKAWSRALDLVK